MYKNTESQRESLLSAHLDGELSAEERQAAEASLATDKAAADELRSLAGVRNLVAGLPRPTGPDLAPAVMERLKDRRIGPRTIQPANRRRIASLVAGVAASVALLALFGGRLRPTTPTTRPNSLPSALPDSAATTPAPPSAVVETEIAGPPAPPPTVESPVAIAATEPEAPKEAPAAEPARAPIPGLADDADPLVFSVVDRDAEAARKRVAALLGLSTHRDFHQIKLPPAEAPGDNDAAAAPARATVVFAATLDPNEAATLRERLATAFPEGLDEGGPAATLTPELAAKSRVSTLPANPAGDVSFPQIKFALRFPPQDRSDWPESTPADGEAQKADSPATGAAPQAEADQPRSVLVWIVEAPKD